MRHFAARTLRAMLLFSIILVLPQSFFGQTRNSKKSIPSARKVTTESDLKAEEGPALRVKGHIRKERRAPGQTASDASNARPVGPAALRVTGRPREDRLERGHAFQGDLRTLPQIPPQKFERPEREGPLASPRLLPGTVASNAKQAAPAPSAPLPSAPAPAPTSSFDGLDFATWGAGHPPDTNGDVGPVYYIQTINTSIGIFRKSDGVRISAFTFNSFLNGHFGNLCDTNNFGDPVVVYDTFEDRWIITDFAFILGGGNPAVPV